MGLFSSSKTVVVYARDKESGIEQKHRFSGTQAEIDQCVNTLKACGMTILEIR